MNIRFGNSKRKKRLKTKKKVEKRFFLLGILKFKKPLCRRFKILKPVFKMFKPRFEKRCFAHPYKGLCHSLSCIVYIVQEAVP